MAAKTKKQPPRHLKAKHKWKEQWLNEAMAFVREHFKRAGYEVPEHVRISTGWPSKGAVASKKRRIGEAWSNKCSGDDVHEIIISLYLDDPVEVLAVLVHEVIHVTVGVEHGHKKPFTDCMKAVGLGGKATATVPSEELVPTLKGWAKRLGAYPHARLDGLQAKKQTTRLLGLTCEDCGCKVRITQRWLDEYDTFTCPCGGTFEQS